MTRTEHILYRSRHLLWMTAALLILGGGVTLSLLLIHRESAARQDVSKEADLRGSAVSTLAGDVRQLRSQLQAEGKTPAAPDPAKAVRNLPARAAVPVPRPGPSGPPGKSGKPGRDAPTISPSPGPSGVPGADSTVQGPPGADSTVSGPSGPAGPTGPAGRDGTDGKDGTNGSDGQDGTTSCPDGYEWQTPTYDADARVCRRTDAAPAPPQDGPGPSDGTVPLAAGLDPQRRQYP